MIKHSIRYWNAPRISSRHLCKALCSTVIWWTEIPYLTWHWPLVWAVSSLTGRCVYAQVSWGIACVGKGGRGTHANVRSGPEQAGETQWLMLTLNMQGPSYLGFTRSLSLLLMPWLLTSPGHQHTWYWQCRIGKSLSYLRKDIPTTCVISMWSHNIECKCMFSLWKI